MSDIKARLARLAVLANGPILNWPHLADVATEAAGKRAAKLIGKKKSR